MDEKIFKQKLEKIVDFYTTELQSIRTGRANPSLIENLMVECYGSKMPLVQLASISAPEPKMLLIQPWDKNNTKEIEKAIQKSSLGLNPVNEGAFIRLVIPPMTEERRNELVKVTHQMLEQAKIKIRSVREEVHKAMKQQKNDGLIPEDQFYQDEKTLQKIVDEFHQTVEEKSQEKEKEIMTI